MTIIIDNKAKRLLEIKHTISNKRKSTNLWIILLQAVVKEELTSFYCRLTVSITDTFYECDI